MSTTRLARHIPAPRARIYRALLDPTAVEHWMVPDQMTSRVHSFDAREGRHVPHLVDVEHDH